MKFKILSLVFVGLFGLSYADLTFAAETVGTSAVKKVGNLVSEGRSFDDLLADPQLRSYVEKNALKKFRAQHGCLGPEAEKDSPTEKYDGKSMRCSDFLTYQGAVEKSEDLATACKKECLKGALKSADGKSAAALQTCLNESCEKACDFKNISLKTELDSFLKGTIDQYGLDAASM